MATRVCANCGRTWPTRWQWGHHGCERVGPTRDLFGLYRDASEADWFQLGRLLNKRWREGSRLKF